jgi:hypothetical protein
MRTRRAGNTLVGLLVATAIAGVAIMLLIAGWRLYRGPGTDARTTAKTVRTSGSTTHPGKPYDPREAKIDTAGFSVLPMVMQHWQPDATLEEISRIWRGTAYRAVENLDWKLAEPGRAKREQIPLMFMKAALLNYEGEGEKSYQVLEKLRSIIESEDKLAVAKLGRMIYFQGVTALRRGETDNCIMCRGESSCIIPISPAAVHTNPTGSRLAIKHFTE